MDTIDGLAATAPLELTSKHQSLEITKSRAFGN